MRVAQKCGDYHDDDIVYPRLAVDESAHLDPEEVGLQLLPSVL